MAGEISADTTLKVVGWAIGGVAYGAALITYVKMQLKRDREEIVEIRRRVSDVESAVARGVRPQDIKQLRDDIKELRLFLMGKQ